MLDILLLLFGYSIGMVIYTLVTHKDTPEALPTCKTHSWVLNNIRVAF